MSEDALNRMQRMGVAWTCSGWLPDVPRSRVETKYAVLLARSYIDRGIIVAGSDMIGYDKNKAVNAPAFFNMGRPSRRTPEGEVIYPQERVTGSPQ
jgi:hypothetical protein